MGTEKSPIWFQVPDLVSLIWPGLERSAEQPKANRRTREKRTVEPQNRRISNVEGWYRYALSIFRQ